METSDIDVGLSYYGSSTNAGFVWWGNLRQQICRRNHYDTSISAGMSNLEKANSFLPKSFSEAPM